MKLLNRIWYLLTAQLNKKRVTLNWLTNVPELEVFDSVQEICMPRGILLYHILNIVRFKSFSELLTCHKILQLRARQWINTIRNRETHHKPHQWRDITQNKRNYVSAHNKETCMSLLAVFMFPCANNELFNHIHVQIYTGCPRRNGQNFGRVFFMLQYTDITQNTYIQSWTVTEIMAREKCGHLLVPCIVCIWPCCVPITAHFRPWTAQCVQSLAYSRLY